MKNHHECCCTRLPQFDLREYEVLLRQLAAHGYVFRPIDELKAAVDAPTVYMRHDVDIHIAGVEEMAALEASLGICATYYVMVSQHYNVLSPDNRRILRTVAGLGHEIGLHYDLESYPTNAVQAEESLNWEIAVLERAVGAPVKTISMHQPHNGLPDPFLMLDEFVNPRDPRYQDGLLYVSDSCRAWRDESLLACFSRNSPRRVMILCHPELWLDGAVSSRMLYLNQVLLKNAVRQYREYLQQTVRQIWATHPGPRMHDEREKQ